VICHESASMVASTATRVTTFETSEARVEVKACCAPITSVFRRVTSEPVWVRVKKAMDCC